MAFNQNGVCFPSFVDSKRKDKTEKHLLTSSWKSATDNPWLETRHGHRWRKVKVFLEVSENKKCLQRLHSGARRSRDWNTEYGMMEKSRLVERQRTIEWWWRGEVFRKHTPSANGGSLNLESWKANFFRTLALMAFVCFFLSIGVWQFFF